MTDMRAALAAIVARSNTDELGTSKVNDMRKLALEALASEPEPAGVKVRALEWDERSGSFYADTITGEACIEKDDFGLFDVVTGGRRLPSFPTAKAAKAFVQDSHDKSVKDWLILSAIESTAPASHEPTNDETQRPSPIANETQAKPAANVVEALRDKLTKAPRHDRGFAYESDNSRSRGPRLEISGPEWASLCMWIIDNHDDLLAALAPAHTGWRDMDSAPKELHVVFEDMGGPSNLRFVEVETPEGRSVRAGTWLERDGYKVLALTVHASDLPAAPAKEG